MFWIFYSVGIAVLALLFALVITARSRTLQRRLERSLENTRRLEDDLERAAEWRRRAEARLKYLDEALRTKQARYNILFNNARDMTFLYKVNEQGLPGKIVEANDVACTRLKRSRKDLLALSPPDIEEKAKGDSMVRLYSKNELAIISDEEIQYRRSTSDRQLIKQIQGHAEVRYERTYLTGRGERIPVEVRAQEFELDGEHLILCTAHDLTERKQVQKRVREGQRRLHDLLAHSPIGSAVYDADCELVDINTSCLHMFGVPDEAAFRHVDLFDNRFTPADALTKLARKDAVRYEAVFDFDVVRNQGLFVSRRRGKVYFDVVMINLGMDSEYKPRGYIFQIQDITQRREAEMALREKERELRRSQKLEAIGSLASGIAHDFNNILTPIMGYTDLIMESGPDSDTLQDYMSEILTASHRAKDLVNQILTFSRESEHEEVDLRLTPIVKEVLKMTQASARGDIEYRRSLRAENDAVRANPVQIHQVLMNLCTNAAYAMRETGGVLEVTMANVTVESSSEDQARLSPGRYVRVTVRDTGTGIPEDVQDRIFEPFFTTKEPGEGTGMGLAVVHGIVTTLQGAITVESTPGEGAVFHLSLPAVELAEAAPVDTATRLPRGTEHILVVDDEEPVLRMIRRMLEGLGYAVATERDPREALASIQRDPQDVNLLITDQRMPEMSGAELAQQALEVRPDLPIVMCTGFSPDFSPRQGTELGIREFIMKPIVLRSLSEAVRRVLDEGNREVGREQANAPTVPQPAAV